MSSKKNKTAPVEKVVAEEVSVATQELVVETTTEVTQEVEAQEVEVEETTATPAQDNDTEENNVADSVEEPAKYEEAPDAVQVEPEQKKQKYGHIFEELKVLVKTMNHEGNDPKAAGNNRFRFIRFIITILELPEEAPEHIRAVLQLFHDNRKTSLSHTRMLAGLNGGIMTAPAFAEAVAIFNFMSRMASPESRYQTAKDGYDWNGLQTVMQRNAEKRIESMRAACNV